MNRDVHPDSCDLLYGVNLEFRGKTTVQVLEFLQSDCIHELRTHMSIGQTYHERGLIVPPVPSDPTESIIESRVSYKLFKFFNGQGYTPDELHDNDEDNKGVYTIYSQDSEFIRYMSVIFFYC